MNTKAIAKARPFTWKSARYEVRTAQGLRVVKGKVRSVGGIAVGVADGIATELSTGCAAGYGKTIDEAYEAFLARLPEVQRIVAQV